VTNVDDMRGRILDGALEALAVYGSRRFSMSSVGDLAKISRGTVYRYFSTKDDLLNALTAHMGSDFRRHMRERLRAEVEPEHRIHAVVAAMWDYVEQTPILTQLLEAEPEFVKSFYEQQFPDLVRLVATKMAPPNGKVQPTKAQLLAAELMVRLAMSYRIVGRSAGVLAPETFSDLFADMLLANGGVATGAKGA
jgi:AcrR family transcriptional regulator